MSPRTLLILGASALAATCLLTTAPASTTSTAAGGLACSLGPATQPASSSPYPSLQWSAGTCPRSQVEWYDVQTADDAAFTVNLKASHSYVPRFVPARALKAGEHHWRVRAVSATGATSPWAYGTVKITDPGPVIDVPAGGSIQQGLDEARTAGGGVVQLAAGATYRLTCPTGASTCLTANGERDVRLEGQGAHLLVTSPTHGLIDLRGTRDVVLRDFTVDYETLPYSEGRVVAVNRTAGTVDVTLLPGMPDLLAAHITSAPINWAQLLDPAMPGVLSPHAGGVTAVSKVARLAGSTFRLTTALANRAQVGDILHKEARISGLSIVLAGHAVDPALVRLTVYASPSGLVNAPDSHGLVMLHNQVLVKAGRYASTDADVVHIPDADLGPWIEDNYLWGGLDDFANLRPTARTITARTATSVTVDDVKGILPGTTVSFYRYRDGATMTRTVLAVRGATLTLDGAPGAGEHLYSEATANPLTVVRFNTFRGGLRYGLLLRTPHVAVEGNLFEYNQGAAIAIENHPFRSDEGLVATDVWLVHNRIRDDRDTAGAILTRVLKCDSDGPSPCSRTTSTVSRAVTGLHLFGNEVDGGYGVSLSNTEGAQLDGNIASPLRITNSTSPLVIGTPPLLAATRQGARVGPAATTGSP